MKRTRFALAALLGLAALSPIAAAQESPAAWNLVTADLRAESVVLKELAATGAKVSPAAGGADKSIDVAQFIELSRNVPPVPATGKFDLHLVGGDRVNGEPVGIVDEEDLVFRNSAAGEFRFPLRLVSGLTPAGMNLPADRRKNDIITLTNRDQIAGTITELTPQKVSILEGSRTITIEFARVAAIALAPTAAGAKDKPFFRVKLDEKSVLFAPTVKLAGDNLEMTVGKDTRSVPLARIALIEQVNGPVAFLANRHPTANVYTPFFGVSQRFVARMHTDFDGDPIRFRERPFPRSIAAHSYSRISWPLDGSYVTLRTRYALDPKNGSTSGDVTVRIKLDDKVVHEQVDFRAGSISPIVQIDLGTARTLTFEVDYGRRVDAGDRFFWLEPALLRTKPAEK